MMYLHNKYVKYNPSHNYEWYLYPFTKVIYISLDVTYPDDCNFELVF